MLHDLPIGTRWPRRSRSDGADLAGTCQEGTGSRRHSLLAVPMNADDLATLGKIVMNAAALDHFAGLVLRGFLADTVPAHIIVADEPFGWRLRKIRPIAEALLDDGPKRAVLDWLSQAQAAMDHRNAVLHSTIVFENQDLSGEQRLHKPTARKGTYTDEPRSL